MMNAGGHKRESGRLSLRNSIVIWVTSAVLGWIVLVSSVYQVVRTSSDGVAERGGAIERSSRFAEDATRDLTTIAPASGGASIDEQPQDPVNDEER